MSVHGCTLHARDTHHMHANSITRTLHTMPHIMCISVPLHARRTHMTHALYTSTLLHARHTPAHTSVHGCTPARTRRTPRACMHYYTHTAHPETCHVHACTPTRTPHAQDTRFVHEYTITHTRRAMTHLCGVCIGAHSCT